MKKLRLVILGAAILAVGLGIFHHRKQEKQRAWQESHVIIEGTVYSREEETLDLRGQDISQAHYDALRQALPNCEILWDVPFQGGRISCAITELTLAELTEEDLHMLDYFPNLATVHGEGCQDYAQLAALQAARPECQVAYQVTLGDQVYALDTRELELEQGDPEELKQKLLYLPGLQNIHFCNPDMDAEALLELVAAFPEITFTWDKTVLGQSYPQDTRELDFSGTPLTGVEELERALAYFPELETLVLMDCGLDNETLAAYRDRVREDYKVVWAIQVNTKKIRTDATTFMPGREGIFVRDQHLTELKYCEDLIVVDIGHNGVKNVDWLYHMPHMQYLVLADTKVEDITPVGTLKELVYLELFKCPNLRDYTPLLGCTALEDLNLAHTFGDVTVLAKMTWLKALWANSCGASNEAKQLLRDSLPDTLLELDHGWHMGNGWRNREHYYKMRDLLGMPYYDWGSDRLKALQGGA